MGLLRRDETKRLLVREQVTASTQTYSAARELLFRCRQQGCSLVQLPLQLAQPAGSYDATSMAELRGLKLPALLQHLARRRQTAAPGTTIICCSPLAGAYSSFDG